MYQQVKTPFNEAEISEKEVIAPGTVIISATGHTNDLRKTIEPYLTYNNSNIYYKYVLM